MSEFLTEKELHEMQREARGNTGKIARYMTAKGEHAEFIDKITAEERPVFARPTADQLAEMEREVAEGAFEHAKERLAYHQRLANEATALEYDWKRVNLVQSQLKRALQEGKVTEADRIAAKKLAGMNPTPANIALFTQINRTLAGPGE